MNRTTLLIAAGLLALSGAARASVLWSGDFSTGDLSQWPKKEVVGADRLKVVPDPLGSGRPVLRTRVVKGDDPIGASGNRNEVVYRDDRPQEGEERFYRWQTLFPDDFESADWYQIFTQWHQYVAGGSPPLAFMAWGEEIKLGSGPRDYWSVPLERGRWHDFVVRIVWSSDPGVGGVEIWYDGEHSLPFTHGATLFPNDTVYLKQGLYRKQIIEQEQVVYHSGMTIATSLQDVQPQRAPRPAAVASADPVREPTEAGGSTAQGGQPLATGVPGVTVLSQEGAGCSSAGVAGLLPLAAPLAALAVRRRRRP